MWNLGYPGVDCSCGCGTPTQTCRGCASYPVGPLHISITYGTFSGSNTVTATMAYSAISHGWPAASVPFTNSAFLSAATTGAHFNGSFIVALQCNGAGGDALSVQMDDETGSGSYCNIHKSDADITAATTSCSPLSINLNPASCGITNITITS